MRIAVLLLLAGTTPASADEQQPWSKTTTERRLGIAMRDAWGSSNTIELAGRFDIESESEWTNGSIAFELGGGAIGGHPAAVVGATAQLLVFHTAGLGVAAHVLRASDDGAHYLARVGIGFRMRGIELGYAYQRPLGGDREDWMATHMLVIGLHVPLFEL